jgi:hypothetical protein
MVPLILGLQSSTMESFCFNHGAVSEVPLWNAPIGRGWCLAAPQLAFGEGEPQVVPTPLCALRNLKIKLCGNKNTTVLLDTARFHG